MRKPAANVPPNELYARDFFAWTQAQGKLLRAGRLGDLDPEHLAEEIEAVGRGEQDEIESCLLVLLAHLLVWRHRPDERSGGWRAVIRGQRRRIHRRIELSPSLAGYPAEVLAGEYAAARIDAADVTGLDPESFPESCPFTLDQILDPDYLPGDET